MEGGHKIMLYKTGSVGDLKMLRLRTIKKAGDAAALPKDGGQVTKK
jgi:hypothetical protein